MRAAVIINKSAGTASNGKDITEQLNRLLCACRVESEIFLIEAREIKKQIEALIPKGFDTVVIAGGDGTLSSGASVLAGTDIPMGIIPLGTLNHFARDLGIPLEIENSVKLIAKGRPRKVDIGEVNGNIFINNSSVGLYPRAVKFRDKHIERLGAGKWLAMIMASLSVFTRFPLFNIRLETDEKIITRRTPFVFIGNNEYKLDLFNLGKRETLQGGKLSLYTAHIMGRWSLLKIAFLALINRLDQTENFDLQFVENIRLETRKRKVAVSLDGEVIHLAPPLHYKIRPLGLNVILPEKDQEPK
ncbi:MAG: sphingosine kinase [Ignavibacteria bacterium]|jgi:diacylglycerol kinase family enzyme|nr:sphingosine kinase [Ignavibacteria bacterium]MCU7504937.1 sphingosine kinase [Ignavibacteria bacterium]MCU7518404.1 sphingosine kinase [Ignavibacteria bacterium]